MWLVGSSAAAKEGIELAFTTSNPSQRSKRLMAPRRRLLVEVHVERFEKPRRHHVMSAQKRQFRYLRVGKIRAQLSPACFQSVRHTRTEGSLDRDRHDAQKRLLLGYRDRSSPLGYGRVRRPPARAG